MTETETRQRIDKLQREPKHIEGCKCNRCFLLPLWQEAVTLRQGWQLRAEKAEREYAELRDTQAAQIQHLQAENARLTARIEWQPIATAPKDGRWFWVRRIPSNNKGIEVSAFHWDPHNGEHGWFAGTGWWHQFPMNFTHWSYMIGDQPADPPAREGTPT